MTEVNWKLIRKLHEEIKVELFKATEKFGKFNTGHEGYAILLEEVEELWSEVKLKNQKKMRTEAIQVCAMALRFIHDVIGK